MTKPTTTDLNLVHSSRAPSNLSSGMVSTQPTLQLPLHSVSARPAGYSGSSERPPPLGVAKRLLFRRQHSRVRKARTQSVVAAERTSDPGFAGHVIQSYYFDEIPRFLTQTL